MKKQYLSIVVFLCLIMSAEAQDYHQIIHENPAWAASSLYYYDYVETPETPAPKGYEPFYINHYGRHGSRYMSSSVESDAVESVFRTADSCNLLTEAGKLFWKDLKAVLEEQDGVVGMLTSRGAREQYGIGERMASRCRRVFRRRNGRNLVNCISSISPRCLLSMTNLTDALRDNTEGLIFSYKTGNRYYAYLAYHPEVEEGLILSGNKEMAFRRSHSHPEEIIGYFFTDPERIYALAGDPYVFERRLYQFSCVGHLTDFGKCLLGQFPKDVLIRNWEARNARFYVAYANSKELPYYATEVATPLISELIREMDAALEGDSNVAADLNFGHDVTLMPLISHLGIEGMDEKLSFEEVNGKWNSSDFICMGSNIQFIFYRNKKGDILVKVLYNEKERLIPALKSVSGPYYKWSDLKGHMLDFDECTTKTGR